MPRLTARGIAFLIVAVAVGVLAYVFERPELLPIAAIAGVAPLVALVTVATSRPRVRVGRQLEPVIATEGEQVQVRVTVTGRARAAEWVEKVAMAPGFAGPGRLREVTSTRPGTIGYRYWPGRRGLVSIGPLLIEDRDPFALAVQIIDTRSVITQLVLPTVTPLPVGPVPDPSTEAGPRTTRSRERANDDVVTREYRDGDALRRVHWRVTARRGELMVRQDAPQAGPHSRLIIDTQSVGYRDVVLARDLLLGRRTPQSATFEWTIRMAASAAVHLAERGYTVELVTPTERAADAPAADGPVGDVLGDLALLTLGTAFSDFSDLRDFGDLAGRASSGTSPLVAIAGAPDDATVQWMLAQRSARAPAVVLLAGAAAPHVRGDDFLDPDPVRSEFERAGWGVARVSIRHAHDAAWLMLLGDQPDAAPDWAMPRAVLRG